ncbi:hypothetical protein HDU67_002745 [Dinochytrium kinnereticum]|nr:hypothetical protein HDU67_002745 [Dinochytrium kinnereticum]
MSTDCVLIRGSTIGVGMFYILSGRVLAISFLKKKDPLVLASSILRRPMRLIWPAIGAQLIHYAFYHLGLYTYGPEIKERFPGFSMVVESTDKVPTLFETFTQPLIMYNAGPLPKYPAGVQWTLARELSGSFLTFTVAFVFAPDFQNWLDEISGVYTLDEDGNYGKPVVPPYWKFRPSKFWGALSLLILAESSDWLQWFLETPPVRFVAKVSFGFYLLHPVASASFGTWLISVVVPDVTGERSKIEHLTFLQAWIIYLGIFGMSVFLGWIFYLTFDQQSIVMGKWIEKFVAQPRTPVKEKKSESGVGVI